MNAPRYVIQKMGDRYVPVLQEPYPKATRTVYVGWGVLLAYLGAQRRGVLRLGLFAGSVSLIVRGTFGWHRLKELMGVRKPARDGKGVEAPSYQNDFRGRAGQLPADLVDEQGMESFPASDPPARTARAES